MARGSYARLPFERRQSASERAAAHEMDAAFASDDDDDMDLHTTESTPLAGSSSHQRRDTVDNTIESRGQAPAYDFERDYDYPPPGSPPAAASSLTSGPGRAAVGNSNGIIPPSSPTTSRRGGFDWTSPRPSAGYFRRAVGALLPSHWQLARTDNRARGSGIENDGVFSNVQAQATPARMVRDEEGNVAEAPEDAQKDAPPSYAVAQADAVPPYWETTIHAPHLGSQDEPLIDGLPAGSIFSFAWNFLISISFQFVGFMVTYLLHTSHAAKYGSRAGLGVTLIQYGLYSKETDMSNVVVDDSTMMGMMGGGGGGEGGSGGGIEMPSAAGAVLRRSLGMIFPKIPKRGLEIRTWSTMMSTTTNDDSTTTMQSEFTMSSAHDWISFLLMTLGWFLLLSSLLGYLRAKRWENSLRESARPAPSAPTADQIAAEQQVRSQLRNIFGIDLSEEHDDEVDVERGASAANEDPEGDENDRLVRPVEGENPRFTPEQMQREEDFRRDLRSVGLL